MNVVYLEHRDHLIVLTQENNVIQVNLNRFEGTDELHLECQPEACLNALARIRVTKRDSDPITFFFEGTPWAGEVMYFAKTTSEEGNFSLRMVKGPPYGRRSMFRETGVYVVKFNDETRLSLIELLEQLPT